MTTPATERTNSLDAYRSAEIAALVKNVGALLRNWDWVIIGNAAGALLIAGLAALPGLLDGNFAALGFEHSAANFSMLPLGGVFGNLVPVTLGNIVGGGVGVALSYLFAYPELSAIRQGDDQI